MGYDISGRTKEASNVSCGSEKKNVSGGGEDRTRAPRKKDQGEVLEIEEWGLSDGYLRKRELHGFFGCYENPGINMYKGEPQGCRAL